MSFFSKIEKLILKFIEKHKRLQIARVILSKKRNCESIYLEVITTLDFNVL
jgi:hypothetical protein